MLNPHVSIEEMVVGKQQVFNATIWFTLTTNKTHFSMSSNRSGLNYHCSFTNDEKVISNKGAMIIHIQRDHREEKAKKNDRNSMTMSIQNTGNLFYNNVLLIQNQQRKCRVVQRHANNTIGKSYERLNATRNKDHPDVVMPNGHNC